MHKIFCDAQNNEQKRNRSQLTLTMVEIKYHRITKEASLCLGVETQKKWQHRDKL